MLYLIFLYGPVLLLPLFSFNDSILRGLSLEGFTLRLVSRDGGERAADRGASDSLRSPCRLPWSARSWLLAAMALRATTCPGARRSPASIMLPLVIPAHRLALALLVVLRRILDSSCRLDRRRRPCAALRSLSMLVLIVAARRLRQEPGGGLHRSGRECLADLLARHLSPGAARASSQPAALLHRLLRRICAGLLPQRHRADPSGLHLQPAALPPAPARRARAGQLHPRSAPSSSSRFASGCAGAAPGPSTLDLAPAT